MNSCPKCQQNFSCNSSSTCWCIDYPNILPLDESPCLCPSCLKKEIQEKIKDLVSNPTDASIKKIKSLGTVSKLIEGIDYFTNKNGLMVFTKWYHLRRGYCCESGCQECPYHS